MAYYLMQDNRRRMPSSAYLRAELSEASDAAHSYPSGAHPCHGPASGAECAGGCTCMEAHTARSVEGGCKMRVRLRVESEDQIALSDYVH